ncbi:MAG: DMT family transporter [Deltaproteobacteria bacterium]|nr:DMT family transporter [Deltaproteobacteria bacterium]MDQ3296773.1 DMT family transporter [Myxococcota bacterium]
MFAGFVMVTLAAASWGTWSLFLRPTGLSATVTTPIVFLVMGLVTLPFALRMPRATWDRETRMLLVANAAFDALNILTFFAALNYTTVSIAVLSHYIAPILIAIAAPRIDGTSARGVAPATCVALAGLVIILEPWRAPADGAAMGATLGLLSACCYTGNVFTVRRLAARIGATRAMSYHSLLAAVVLTPLLVIGAGAVSADDLALITAGATTIGAASGVIFVIGLGRIGSARAAVLTFAEPLVAVTVGALVWGEALHPLAALGGAMVIGAGIHVAGKAR